MTPILLPDGRTVFFHSALSPDPEGPSSRLAIHVTGPDGARPVESSFLDLQDLDARHEEIGATLLENGDIRAFWHESRDLTIHAQDFAPDGQARGLAQLVEDAGYRAFTNPVMLTLGNGNIVYGETQIWVIDQEFNRLPTDGGFTTWPATFPQQFNPYAGALARIEGGFAWATMDMNTDERIMLHLFDEDFGQIALRIPVGSGLNRVATGRTNDAIDVVELSDGRLAVAYASRNFPDAGFAEGTGNDGVFLTVLNRDGSVSIPEMQIDPLDAAEQEEGMMPRLWALDDGGFVAGWTVWPSRVELRRFDDAGTELEAQSYDRNDPEDPIYRKFGELVIEPEGDSYFVTDTATFPLESFGGSPAPVVRGSEADETLEGTEASERILAFGGDDLIRPGGGADTIDGGAGVDMLDFHVQPFVDGLTDSSYLLDLSLTLGVADVFGVGLHVVIDIENATGTAWADSLAGDALANTLVGLGGADRLIGLEGDDVLNGGHGPDTLNGGDGEDRITGGPDGHEADQSNVIYAGAGDDRAEGGGGNDFLYGQEGNDSLAGGFGADRIEGQGGDDVLTGGALSDLVFGGDGNDFVNGGFGHDRINGGSGADSFFHLGVTDHGSDWVQDYIAAEGDVLVFGGAATAADFQINYDHTATPDGERSGDDGVQEAFVIYRPTGQIVWALVDGEGQAEISLRIGGEIFDLMA